MWNKIKYWIDNLTDKDEEEQVSSRRKFLFTIPAVIVLPEIIKNISTDEVLTINGVRDSFGLSPISHAFPYGSSGMIITDYYNKDIVEQVAKAFQLKPEYLGLQKTRTGDYTIWKPRALGPTTSITVDDSAQRRLQTKLNRQRFFGKG